LKRSEIAERFEKLLRQVKPIGQFSEDAHLKEQYEMDSVDVMMFLFDVEAEFGIKIPEEDVAAHKLLRISNMFDYIEKKAS
jgi:acyl carrier protein